jgi:hypothetical protein
MKEDDTGRRLNFITLSQDVRFVSVLFSISFRSVFCSINCVCVCVCVCLKVGYRTLFYINSCYRFLFHFSCCSFVLLPFFNRRALGVREVTAPSVEPVVESRVLRKMAYERAVEESSRWQPLVKVLMLPRRRVCCLLPAGSRW